MLAQYTPREQPAEVTTIPQAMRLIQSLSQMISHSASRKNFHAQTNFERNKIRVSERGKKKNMLQSEKRNTQISIPISKRAKYDDSDMLDDLNSNEKTLKMLIRNKKRSDVLSRMEKNKHGHQAKSHKKAAALKKQQIKKIGPQSVPMPPQPVTPNVPPPPTPVAPQPSYPQPSVTQATPRTTRPPPPPPPGQPQPQKIYTPATPMTTITTVALPQPITTTPLVQQPITQKEMEMETTTEVVGLTETTTLQTTVPPSASSAECDPSTDDCPSRYSMILKQSFDPDYEDTTSSKYSMLKGNVVQDLNYVLGSDSVIGEVEFEMISGKSASTSLTKVYFNVSGDLSNISKLEDMVDTGNVNGLKVQPHSFHKE